MNNVELIERSRWCRNGRNSLGNNLTAIAVKSSADGEGQWEPVEAIPYDADLEYCGPGYDANTAKTRWRGNFYYVFTRELPNLYTG